MNENDLFLSEEKVLGDEILIINIFSSLLGFPKQVWTCCPNDNRQFHRFITVNIAIFLTQWFFSSDMTFRWSILIQIQLKSLYFVEIPILIRILLEGFYGFGDIGSGSGFMKKVDRDSNPARAERIKFGYDFWGISLSGFSMEVDKD